MLPSFFCSFNLCSDYYELKGVLVIMDQHFTDELKLARGPGRGHTAVCGRVRGRSLDYILLLHVNNNKCEKSGAAHSRLTVVYSFNKHVFNACYRQGLIWEHSLNQIAFLHSLQHIWDEMKIVWVWHWHGKENKTNILTIIGSISIAPVLDTVLCASCLFISSRHPHNSVRLPDCAYSTLE